MRRSKYTILGRKFLAAWRSCDKLAGRQYIRMIRDGLIDLSATGSCQSEYYLMVERCEIKKRLRKQEFAVA